MSYGNGEMSEAEEREFDLEMLREDLVGELNAINQYQAHIETLEDEDAIRVLGRRGAHQDSRCRRREHRDKQQPTDPVGEFVPNVLPGPGVAQFMRHADSQFIRVQDSLRFCADIDLRFMAHKGHDGSSVEGRVHGKLKQRRFVMLGAFQGSAHLSAEEPVVLCYKRGFLHRPSPCSIS